MPGVRRWKRPPAGTVVVKLNSPLMKRGLLIKGRSLGIKNGMSSVSDISQGFPRLRLAKSSQGLISASKLNTTSAKALFTVSIVSNKTPAINSVIIKYFIFRVGGRVN